MSFQMLRCQSSPINSSSESQKKITYPVSHCIKYPGVATCDLNVSKEENVSKKSLSILTFELSAYARYGLVDLGSYSVPSADKEEIEYKIIKQERYVNCNSESTKRRKSYESGENNTQGERLANVQENHHWGGNVELWVKIIKNKNIWILKRIKGMEKTLSKTILLAVFILADWCTNYIVVIY